jgi:hypothetical protein
LKFCDKCMCQFLKCLKPWIVPVGHINEIYVILRTEICYLNNKKIFVFVMQMKLILHEEEQKLIYNLDEF